MRCASAHLDAPRATADIRASTRRVDFEVTVPQPSLHDNTAIT